MFRKEVPLEDLLELDDNDIEVDDIETSDEGELESTVNGAPSKRQPAKVNLDEFDDFRKFKSERQKEAARLENMINHTQQELERERAWRRQVELEGLDDVGRLRYERDEALRILQQRDADEQRRYQEFQWNSLVEEVARETGTPVDELVEAKDSNDLWRIGRRYEREKAKRRGYDDDDDDVVRRPVDDRVHLGGGKPTTSAQKIQSLYNKALADYDLDGMFAAEERAIKAGIRLKHQQ